MDQPEKPDLRTVELRIVGPVTRSTTPDSAVSPRDEAFDDALHWIWSWNVQIRRLKESFELEWKDGAPLERRRAASQFSYDEHILTVVGWNLVRAIQRAQPFLATISLPREQAEALRLLRHLYEHWDEQRAAFRSASAPKVQSAKAFAAQFPDGKPWSMVFDKDDWILGGVVRLNDLTRVLVAMESAILAAEARHSSDT
jgi:hypothetical protein